MNVVAVRQKNAAAKKSVDAERKRSAVAARKRSVAAKRKRSAVMLSHAGLTILYAPAVLSEHCKKALQKIILISESGCLWLKPGRLQTAMETLSSRMIEILPLAKYGHSKANVVFV